MLLCVCVCDREGQSVCVCVHVIFECMVRGKVNVYKYLDHSGLRVCLCAD